MSTEATNMQIYRIRKGRTTSIRIPINVLRFTLRDQDLKVLKDYLGEETVKAITEYHPPSA